MSKKDPLYDNPMIEKIKKNMTKEQLEELKRHGEQLFSIDFEHTGTPEHKSEEVYAQIKIMLESGMHPSFLTVEEKNFLRDFIGPKWFERFGYMENDIYRINF